jgi:phospholipase C
MHRLTGLPILAFALAALGASAGCGQVVVIATGSGGPSGSGGSSSQGGLGGSGGPGGFGGWSSGGGPGSGGSGASGGAGGFGGFGGGAGAGGFGGGAGAGGSIAFPTPIEHVIVIVKENHTFDNYFGTFPGAEGTTVCQLKNGTIPCQHAPDLPRDLCHKHGCAQLAWNHGQMNGWEDVPTSSKDGDNLAWAQYHEEDIPNYWQYAKHFTLGDHFFSNVLGPSFPGHAFLIAAQAGWAIGNPPIHIDHPYWGCDDPAGDTVTVLQDGSCTQANIYPCLSAPSLPDVLPPGVTWKFYGTTFEMETEIWSLFDAFDHVRNGPGWANVVNAKELPVDLANHTLPNVAWLVSMDRDNEHPGGSSVCKGENWTVNYVNQIMQSDYWPKTAILLTMDDYGGWYDHVPPPRQYGCDAQNPYGLGMRLPLVVMSPYARPGFIFKEVAEQASIPRLIETLMGAPPLSTLDPAAQDGQANDLMGVFDWGQEPLPPLVLPLVKCPEQQ